MSNGNERGSDTPQTRTLYPIWPRDAWRISQIEAEGLRRICVLDTETTGLDVDRHQVIEICAAMVVVDDVGRVRGIRSIGSGYVDPGEPLDPTITELTGITDADLSGQDIDRDKLASFIEECESVISFNCAFDRPFVEKLLPKLKDVKWDAPWQTYRGANSGLNPVLKDSWSCKRANSCPLLTEHRTTSSRLSNCWHINALTAKP